jgi:hypothetical protein
MSYAAIGEMVKLLTKSWNLSSEGKSSRETKDKSRIAAKESKLSQQSHDKPSRRSRMQYLSERKLKDRCNLCMKYSYPLLSEMNSPRLIANPDICSKCLAIDFRPLQNELKSL